MPYLLILLISVISVFNLQAQQIKKEKTPEWVRKISTNNPSKEEDSAYNYLLIDLQDNLITKEHYGHYMIKVLNGYGVQEMSDISVSFDPTFQKLKFHTVNIIREGQVIEKLSSTIINTFQRETNLERALYDGSLTSVINLTDVRENDIIEYSYSIKGFNPASKGNYSNTIYQEYTSPVNRIYTRLVTDVKNKINYKLLDGASEPIILTSDIGTEYVWDNSGLDNIIYDTNVPYWHDIQKRISVSTFTNWKEVVDLLMPLYQVSEKKILTPIKIDETIKSKEDEILHMIRFVQDEVRYLGFESGIAAYKPNNPKKVLSRRYGDCKDKSLLLVNLLQNNGVKSYPILVNSQSNNYIQDQLPSHYLFNHCIVYFEHNGKEYFIDPTISNQGGNLKNISAPNYNVGLILKDDTKELKKIPSPKKPTVKITENIVIDSIGGNATFIVESEYSGSRANYMRSYFKNNSEESINKEFLNFYSSMYPSITSSKKVDFYDDSRNDKNIFKTLEHYYIESVWSELDTEKGVYFETYPLVLEGMVSYTKTPKREMPYYIGMPYDFEQITHIKLPEPWNISNENTNIDEDSFSFIREIESTSNSVSITYKYQVKEEVIDGSKASSFLKKHNNLKNDLGYQLTYMPLNDDGFQFSWISILIALASIISGIILAIKLYKKYNPLPEDNCENQAIGGWIIIPTIGLILTPFVLLFQVFSNNYFGEDIWSSFYISGYDNAAFLNIYLGFELIYNIWFLIFAVLLIILLFQKRTNFPILMIYFYAINLAMIIIGSVILNQSGIDDPTFFKDLSRALVGAAIWIPYFLNSTRVKNTFGITYQNTNTK